MVLVKAVGALYVRHRGHIKPRADVISLVTVRSVCSDWCAVIGSERSRLTLSRALRLTKVLAACIHLISFYLFFLRRMHSSRG